jgi:predicted Fe-Mo cluster-binding NifX family protein
MKIALPSHQNQIDEHFGHCEYFTVFTIDDQKKIKDEEKIASPPVAAVNRTLPRYWLRRV